MIIYNDNWLGHDVTQHSSVRERGVIQTSLASKLHRKGLPRFGTLRNLNCAVDPCGAVLLTLL